MTRPWLPKVAASLGLFALAFAVRLEQHHSALLYPDGYQYLLMARGIGEHFTPTTVLGPGGELFVPNADAAAKPLYPLVVAAVHALGAGWLSAAEIATCLASAAVVSLTFLLAWRLAGTWLAGAVAALLLLASPSVAFWSGFSGPDPLAQALGLGAALAFVYRRHGLGGLMLALAVAARPELVVVAVCAFVVCVVSQERRQPAIRAAIAFVPTLALVFLALRPPIAAPDTDLLWTLGLLVLCALGAAFVPVERRAVAVLAVLVVAAVAVSVPSAGLAEIWREDWPLVAAGLVGLGIVALDPERRRAALWTLAVAAVLGAVYWTKNPGLDRYFAILLPLAAVLAGVGAAAVVQRWRWSVAPVAVAAVAVVAFGVARGPSGTFEEDVFSRTAQKLAPHLGSGDALVTAAPDAYGFWLPGQPVHTMRPGTRGLVLLDPAQRSYAPDLAARGKVVARVDSELAFSRPDGEIDAGRSVLVAGEVTRTAGSRSSDDHAAPMLEARRGPEP